MKFPSHSLPGFAPRFDEGFRSGQEKNLAELGRNIMFTFAGRIPAVEGSLASAQPYHITYGDYLAIGGEARHIAAISPVLERDDIRASSDYRSTNGQVFGVTPDYNEIRNVPVDNGRWINAEDNNQRRRVAVVGWELLKDMFPGRPALGSTILLNGAQFKVIGVLANTAADLAYKKKRPWTATARSYPPSPRLVSQRMSEVSDRTTRQSSHTYSSRAWQQNVCDRECAKRTASSDRASRGHHLHENLTVRCGAPGRV